MASDDDPTGFIRANLRGIAGWNPTALIRGERRGTVHRMDLNECPYPPSPAVIEALRETAGRINRYPDGVCPELSERLAARTGVPASQICWGTGSSEVLANVIEIAVGPGDGLVSTTPIWRRFAGVYRVLDADVADVPLRPDGALDVDGMMAAIGNNTRIVVCVTPYNPTGLMLSAAEIERVCRETPDNVLLFLDEAYHEFAVHAGGPDALEVVRQTRRGPWVVTRTFSKAYALAGLRLGYALCSHQEIADAMRTLTSTFNITAFAEPAGLAALDDTDYARFLLDRNAEERTRITEGFAALGCRPLPSVTNFVLADIGVPGAPVSAAMRARSIRIGALAEPGWETHIRISMGLPEDTDAFLAALAEILAEQRVAAG